MMSIPLEPSQGKPTFLDFFAGSGLVTLGLDANWECVWANDLDPKKAEVYAANIGQEHFHLGDVAEVQVESLPLGVQMAWASFPCQDLSLAGWRRGMSAERSGTFWAFQRLMKALFEQKQRPPLIVLENVMGLLYDDNFTGLCEALAELDMQFGALVVDAALFVPQSRPRVFVIAVDARVDCSSFQDPWHFSAPWFPKALETAQANLPEHLQELWRWWKMPAPTAPVPSLSVIVESEPTGVKWHSAEQTAKLLDSMTEVNLAKVEKAKAAKTREVGFLYKRTRQGRVRAEVRFDGIAGCLRTPSGGSSRQTVLVVEKGEVRSRLLSIREAARLMGAPDSFVLPSRYNDGYHAMGDAVVVPVVSWLSEHILYPLWEEASKRQEASFSRQVGSFGSEGSPRPSAG